MSGSGKARRKAAKIGVHRHPLKGSQCAKPSGGIRPMREWRVGRRESRQSHTIVMLATARLVSATLPMFARGFGAPHPPPTPHFPLTSAHCRLAKRRQVATGAQPVGQLQTHRRAAPPFVDTDKQRRRHRLRMATGRRRAEAFTACFHSKENVGATH